MEFNESMEANKAQNAGKHPTTRSQGFFGAAEDVVTWDSTDFDVAEIPLLWMGQQFQVLFKKGFFPPPMMAMLHGFVIAARNGIDGIAMQLNSQLPFAYTHLITTLVHGACVLTGVKCGMETAISDSYLAICCRVFFAFSLSLVYLGLLALS